MKRSTANRGAFVILVGLPLWPLCGIVLNVPPAMVFSRRQWALACRACGPRGTGDGVREPGTEVPGCIPGPLGGEEGRDLSKSAEELLWKLV